MDVFLMIRRKKLTIFTDCKDTTTIFELKQMIEGIIKLHPMNLQLFSRDNTVMDDDKTLQDYGMTHSIAKAQTPAPIGLALKMDNGEFEPLYIEPLSPPPELPYVMKSQESNGKEQAS